MEILDKVGDFKEVLAIPKDHSTEEWIIVAAYYSMYMAALSRLARAGFKSNLINIQLLRWKSFL